MAITYEDECVGCDRPCIHDCPYTRVKHLRCDECYDEVLTLYVVDGRQLCRDCAAEEMLNQLEVISYD